MRGAFGLFTVTLVEGDPNAVFTKTYNICCLVAYCVSKKSNMFFCAPSRVVFETLEEVEGLIIDGRRDNHELIRAEANDVSRASAASGNYILLLSKRNDRKAVCVRGSAWLITLVIVIGRGVKLVKL